MKTKLAKTKKIYFKPPINFWFVLMYSILLAIVIYMFYISEGIPNRLNIFTVLVHLIVVILIVMLFIVAFNLRRAHRHQAEENMFKLMFDNANDPLVILNNLIVLDCNSKACELFETSHQKMIGLHISHFSEPLQSNGRSMEYLAKEYKEKVDSGEELTFHWKCILPSQNKIDVEVGIKRMQVGEMSFVLGRLRNITNELDSICRLIESETQFREIVENTNTIILKYDMNGIIQFYNEFAYKLLGYKADEALGKNVFSLLSPYIQPDDLIRPVDTRTWIDYIVKNQFLNPYFENWIITKGGKRLYIGWISKTIQDLDGNNIGIQSIGLDRTENKIIQTKLIESEKKFKLIFNSVSEGIVIVDFDGEILEINDSAMEFIGHKKSELGSMVSLKEVTYSIIPQFDHLASEVNKHGHLLIEIPIYYRDGRVVPSEFHARKIRYNNRDVILSVSRDISERKMHQHEVIRATMNAEESERSRVAKDLHDSVSPILSASKLYAQTLKSITDESLKNQVIDKLVLTITESMKTISEISNKLSPHILENFGLVEALNAFINRISDSTKILFEVQSNFTHRLEMNIEFALYRVLTELINNSIKHSEAKNITIALTITDKLTLTYIDNGKGFDFNQLTIDKRGMGLFNINTRIEAIDGTTKISTKPGAGFKYIATIPYKS